MQVISSRTVAKTGYRHRPNPEAIWNLAERMEVDVSLPPVTNIGQERWLVAMELAKVAKPDLGVDHQEDQRLKLSLPGGRDWGHNPFWWGEGLGANSYLTSARPHSIGRQERWAIKALLKTCGYQVSEVAWPWRVGRRLKVRKALEIIPGSRFSDDW